MARGSIDHVAKDLAILRHAIGCSEGQIETFFWNADAAFHGEE